MSVEMISAVIKNATTLDNVITPFHQPIVNDRQISVCERIVSLALILLVGRFTYGVAILLYSGIAIRRFYQERQIKERIAHYDINLEFEKLRDISLIAQQSSKKICLFVGRTITEEVPHHKNEIWISLDMMLSSRQSLRFIDNRIHLQIDMEKNNELMEKISKCFDKVVVDQSTGCHIKDLFRRMGALLKNNKESTLTVTGYDSNRSSLGKMFSSVELVTTKLYPYPTNWHNADGRDSYFILQGPLHEGIGFPFQE